MVTKSLLIESACEYRVASNPHPVRASGQPRGCRI